MEDPLAEHDGDAQLMLECSESRRQWFERHLWWPGLIVERWAWKKRFGVVL